MDYNYACNRRVERQLGSGRYLIDAASGPVHSKSYKDLSAGFDFRVCVDFSIRALTEAQANIGDHGLFLLGDLTNLPIASGAVDSAISLHTIYHIPEAYQDRAVDELVRAVKPGGRAVIVYTWPGSALMGAAAAITMTLGRLRRKNRKAPPSPASVTKADEVEGHAFYFHAKPVEWHRALADRHGAKLKLFSAVDHKFQNAFFRPGASGRAATKAVLAFERLTGPISARLGKYPMFVIDKR